MNKWSQEDLSPLQVVFAEGYFGGDAGVGKRALECRVGDDDGQQESQRE